MLELPLPPKCLNPNARVHWAVKARAAKKYKESCFYLAKALPSVTPKCGFLLHIQWYPKSWRAFDADNAIASLKSGLDGLALAWGVDDSQFKLSFEKMTPCKGGKVVISRA